jgi:hypothetical protein
MERALVSARTLEMAASLARPATTCILARFKFESIRLLNDDDKSVRISRYKHGAIECPKHVANGINDVLQAAALDTSYWS